MFNHRYLSCRWYQCEVSHHRNSMRNSITRNIQTASVYYCLELWTQSKARRLLKQDVFARIFINGQTNDHHLTKQGVIGKYVSNACIKVQKPISKPTLYFAQSIYINWSVRKLLFKKYRARLLIDSTNTCTGYW